MRSRFKTFAAAAATLMFLPLVAAAGDNDIDMHKMQDMMLQMQDQLAEQQRVLDAQAETIEEAGLDERGAASGIAKFFQSGKAPIDPLETLEIIEFMTAAQMSKDGGGVEVTLEQARKSPGPGSANKTRPARPVRAKEK